MTHNQIIKRWNQLKRQGVKSPSATVAGEADLSTMQIAGIMANHHRTNTPVEAKSTRTASTKTSRPVKATGTSITLKSVSIGTEKEARMLIDTGTKWLAKNGRK